jgi:flagellar basal body-associated protein FliL
MQIQTHKNEENNATKTQRDYMLILLQVYFFILLLSKFFIFTFFIKNLNYFKFHDGIEFGHYIFV